MKAMTDDRRDRHIDALGKLKLLKDAASEVEELRWNIDGHPPPSTEPQQIAKDPSPSLGDFLRDLPADLDDLKIKIEDNIAAIREILF